MNMKLKSFNVEAIHLYKKYLFHTYVEILPKIFKILGGSSVSLCHSL